MAKTFQIAAEYLHTLVGRRVALPAGGAIGAGIPITVGAVRHEPESGLIYVDAVIPHGQLLGMAVGPATLITVEHTGCR